MRSIFFDQKLSEAETSGLPISINMEASRKDTLGTVALNLGSSSVHGKPV